MMVESSSEQGGRVRRRKVWRLVSVFAGVLILVVAGLVVMNMSAGKANGAAASDETTDAKGEDEKKDGDEGEEEKKAPVPVEVVEIEAGTVSAYITSSANLVAENEVRVLSEVEGRVAKIFVREGDLVRQGQVLATLVRDDAEIGMKKAELKETNARLAYERGQDLAEKELISREEFDKFTMESEIAKQELAEANWTLEKTTIRSPFSGRVSERMTQAGQHIRPGDEMYQITDFGSLIARIYLPERDILGLEEGRDVRINLNAAPDVAFAGRIRQISPIVDTATGTIKVTIEATERPEAVRPGSFVTVNIVRETREKVLLVPREAVLRELQTAHVFVALDGEAKKRQVSLGLEEGEMVEAIEGIASGERVIVAGQGGLRDGSPVKILGEEGDVEAETTSLAGAG